MRSDGTLPPSFRLFVKKADTSVPPSRIVGHLPASSIRANGNSRRQGQSDHHVFGKRKLWRSHFDARSDRNVRNRCRIRAWISEHTVTTRYAY